MKNLVLLVLLLLAAPLPAQDTKGAHPVNQSTNQPVNQTRAVVIGISDYQDEGIPDLKYAHRDAEAFANWLRSPAGGALDGDHLKVLTNEQATAGRIAASLDALIEQSKTGDKVIIYFSGHGDVERKTVSQPGFLLAWDAPSRVYMGGGTYSLAFLQEIVTTLATQNLAKVTLITDACHAGKLSGSQIGGAQLTTANLARQFANEVKILSCQPNEYSLEGEQWGGGRGCFSYHLVDGLFGLADRNADGAITVGEIDRYLEDRVTAEAAPLSQVPMLLGSKTERLATVDTAILASLKKLKSGEMPLFAPAESHGLEDYVLAGMDSISREMYRAFKLAVQEKRFFEPAGNCAEDFYGQLTQMEALASLRGEMKRNFAAALQDDAQQVLNARLRSDISEVGISLIKRKEKYARYPKYLEKAANLLGETHYMYKELKGRQYLFEGYLSSLRNPENLDETVGRQALLKYFTSLDYQPDCPHTFYFISHIYAYNLMMADSAFYYANRALKLSPKWVMPCTGLTYRFVKKKNFDYADHLLRIAETIDSNSALVSYTRGVYFYYKGDFHEAENLFQKTISLDSNFFWAYNYLGLLRMDEGKMEDAEIFMLKAISIDSTFKTPYGNLGMLYLDLNRIEEARHFTSMALHLDSNYAFAYRKLGAIYLSEKKYNEAEKNYLKSIELDSTNLDNYVDVGWYYLDIAIFDKAEQMFLKANQLDSNDLYVCRGLGYLYLKTDRFAEAEKKYQKIIQIDTNSIDGYNNLGYCYLYTNQYAEAEQQFNKVVQLNASNSEGYYSLACVHSLQSHKDKALEYLEHALKIGFDYYDHIQQDPDLTFLRTLPEWKALMKKYFPEKSKD